MINLKQNQIPILMGDSMLKIFLFLFIFLFCGDVMAQEKTINMRDDVLSSINGDAVGKIEILHISYDAVANSARLPDRMETIYDRKLFIRDDSLYPYLHSLIDALKETDINRPKIDSSLRWGILTPDMDSDLKWGIILYDFDDRRIVSIYIGFFGMKGYINSTPVTFSSGAHKGLHEWLESNFLKAFSLRKMRRKPE